MAFFLYRKAAMYVLAYDSNKLALSLTYAFLILTEFGGEDK